MSLNLSEDLRHAVESEGTPLKLVDPQTGEAYLLVREAAYAQAQSLLAEAGTTDEALSDSYRAQVESAMRAGWNDPAMDDYNDYDRHRKQ